MGLFTYNGRKLQKRRYLMEDRRMSLDEWIDVYSSLADPKQAYYTSVSSHRSNKPLKSDGSSQHQLDFIPEPELECEPMSPPPDLIKQSTIVSCADLVTESLPPVLQFRKIRDPYSGYIPSMSSPDIDVDGDSTGNTTSNNYGRQLRALAQQLPDNMYPVSVSPDLDGRGDWSPGSLAPLATIDEDWDESVNADTGVFYYQEQSPKRAMSWDRDTAMTGSSRNMGGRKPRLGQKRHSSSSTSSAGSSEAASAVSEVRLYGSCPTRCGD